MARGTYQVLATIMKYWFILLILFILYRTVREIILEYRDIRRSKKDSFYSTVGYLEVLESLDHTLEGMVYPVRRESYIGKGSFCDVRIKIPELAATECFFCKKAGGTFIKNMGSKYGIYVDNTELQGEVPVHDGSTLSLYGVLLKLKLKGGEQ